MRAIAIGSLRLLGRPQLVVNGRAVDPMPKKAFAAAAWLILDCVDLRGSREDVAAFLWSEAEADQRLANLRTLIKRIRAAMRECEVQPFRIDEDAIALDVASISCDLIDLRARIAAARLSDVVDAGRLIDGKLLEGCESGAEPFRSWIDERRRALSRGFARVASKALKGGELLGQPRLREALELKILAARPLEASVQAALLKLQRSRPVASRPGSVEDPASGRALMRDLLNSTDLGALESETPEG